MTDDQMIEDALQEARAVPPMPSDALMARVLADATRRTSMPSWWRVAFQDLGGRAGLSGLVAATVVGVWIGAAPPDGIAASVDALWVSDDAVTTLFGDDIWDGAEG